LFFEKITLAGDGFLKECDGCGGKFLDEHTLGGWRFGDEKGFVGLDDFVDSFDVTRIINLKIVYLFLNHRHFEQVCLCRG
jgi:hypothetical protein